MMAIIRWELWQRRWSILWWCIGVVLMVALIILIYPTFRNQQSLDQTVANIPQAAKSLITDTTDFFSPVGYMSSQLFYLLLPLLFSILTIGLGSSLISKEEQDGRLELLLSRPISRTKLLVSKAYAGIAVLSVVTLATIVATVICAKAVNMGIGSWQLVVACLGSALLSLVFGAIAFTLSAMGRFGRVASLAIAVLIAFGSYLASSLSSIAHWLEWPAKLMPFHYYQPANMMTNNYNWVNLLAFVIPLFVLTLIGIVGFRRRDIE